MSGPHLNVTKTCEVALEQLDKVPPSDAEPQKDVFKVPIAACNSVPAITTPEVTNINLLLSIAVFDWCTLEVHSEEISKFGAPPNFGSYRES